MPTEINGTVYYEAEELAKMLKVSYWTILRWIRQKSIQGHRVGKRYLVSREAVDRYIAEH